MDTITKRTKYMRFFIEGILFTVLFWTFSIVTQVILALACSIIVEIGFMFWRRHTLMLAVSRITETEVNAITTPHRENLK